MENEQTFWNVPLTWRGMTSLVVRTEAIVQWNIERTLDL